MKSTAAIWWEGDKEWSVEEVEVGDPVAHEVLVAVKAAGLCHSDEHVLTGDTFVSAPIIGGHEGAGEVLAVGPGVESVAVGDHVAFSFIPSCGRCRWCASGHTNLCDLGAHLLGGGSIADGTYRMTARGVELNRFCQIGAFARHAVVHEASVVKIEPYVPFVRAAVVSCGVVTGWGSAVNTAEVRAGDTVVVVGAGGVGINAVQGAAHSGARFVVAVDPVPFKRETALSLGATHAVSSVDEARPLVKELTWGVGADAAILTTGVAEGPMIAQLMALVGKTGKVVVTAIAPMLQTDVSLSLAELTLFQKELRGSIFGGDNPRVAIPRLLRLEESGKLELDGLVTRTYPLEDVNEGYRDLRDGRNIRGVLVME
jgi:NDMA-dependent alcohol dehydrogenase